MCKGCLGGASWDVGWCLPIMEPYFLCRNVSNLKTSLSTLESGSEFILSFGVAHLIPFIIPSLSEMQPYLFLQLVTNGNRFSMTTRYEVTLVAWDVM